MNCLEPLGLSVTEASRILGVARHTLSRLLNGHAAISPEMAISPRKSRLGPTPISGSALQATYNLAQARRHEDQIHVKPYNPEPTN